MKTPTELELESPSTNGDLLTQLLEKSDQVLVKKLSNNDRDWSRCTNKHQRGVYIPREQRDSGFFPKLYLQKVTNSKSKPIWESYPNTQWPQANGLKKTSRLVNWRSKKEETHLTRLPKSVFSELLPASFFVMGRIRSDHEPFYECLTLSSDSDEIAIISDIFNLEPDFKIGIFKPAERKHAEFERILEFVEEVIAAWQNSSLLEFETGCAAMPKTPELAALARQSFMQNHGLKNINPFSINSPGDALREISRKIEWDLFREYQRRERSIKLVKIVMGDHPTRIKASDIIRKLINELPTIDALMLSASQQRKSRAGYSYEHHIEAMLSDGEIPFQKQVILTSKKRPDFILPSLDFINSKKTGSETGLILSAKTTLRERWKQVEREMEGRRLFLTTIDENVTNNTIEDMASFGVHLVIPESLKKSKETEYMGHKNVLSFREFCDDILAHNLEKWI